MSFLLLECTIAVAILLALAELVSWWAVPLLPVLVAVMVKVNDMVGGPAKEPVGAVAGSRTSRVHMQRDHVSTPFFDDRPDDGADAGRDGEAEAAGPAWAEREWNEARPEPAWDERDRDADWPEQVWGDRGTDRPERVAARTAAPPDRPTEEIMLPVELTGRSRQRQTVLAGQHGPSERDVSRGETARSNMPPGWDERTAMEHAATTEFQMITDDSYPPSDYVTDSIPTPPAYSQHREPAERAVSEAYRAYDEASAGYDSRAEREVFETQEFPGIRDTADAYGGYPVTNDAPAPTYAAPERAEYGNGHGYPPREYATNEHRAYEYSTREHSTNQRAALEYTTRRQATSGYTPGEQAAAGYTGREHAASDYAADDHVAPSYAAREHAAPGYDARGYAASDYTEHDRAPSGYTASDYTAREHAAAQYAASEYAAGEYGSSEYAETGYDTREQEAARRRAARERDEYAGYDPNGTHEHVFHDANSGRHAAIGEPTDHDEGAYPGSTAPTVPAFPVVRPAHAVQEVSERLTAYAVPAVPAAPTTQPAGAFPTQATRSGSGGSLAAAGSALTAHGRSGGEASSEGWSPTRNAEPEPALAAADQPVRAGSHAASYWSRVAAGEGPGSAPARSEGGPPPNLPGAAAPKRAQLFGAAVRRSMAAQAQQIGSNALGGTTRGASTRRTRDASSDTGRHSRGDGSGPARPTVRLNERGFGRLRDA